MPQTLNTDAWPQTVHDCAPAIPGARGADSADSNRSGLAHSLAHFSPHPLPPARAAALRAAPPSFPAARAASRRAAPSPLPACARIDEAHDHVLGPDTLLPGGLTACAS